MPLLAPAEGHQPRFPGGERSPSQGQAGSSVQDMADPAPGLPGILTPEAATGSPLVKPQSLSWLPHMSCGLCRPVCGKPGVLNLVETHAMLEAREAE